jgi:hypothetical protein
MRQITHFVPSSGFGRVEGTSVIWGNSVSAEDLALRRGLVHERFFDGREINVIEMTNEGNFSRL